MHQSLRHGRIIWTRGQSCSVKVHNFNIAMRFRDATEEAFEIKPFILCTFQSPIIEVETVNIDSGTQHCSQKITGFSEENPAPNGRNPSGCSIPLSDFQQFVQNETFYTLPIISASFSPIIKHGALVLPEVISGMIAASAVLSPWIP